MDNGDSLFDNSLSYFENTSCTQGSLIIKIPNSNYLYYVFSLSPFNYGPGLSYGVVDISYNSGLGKVISKHNLLLQGDLTEKLTAVKHANGRDWWLLGHKLVSDEFYKFLITPDTIEGPFYQSIGSTYDYNSWANIFGELTPSKEGDKLFAVSYKILDYFDFDRCNGEISNWQNFTPPFIDEDWTGYSC